MTTIGMGEIVAIEVWGIVRHWGVVSETGSVISNSMRHEGVVEQPFANFSEGKKIHRLGYPGSLAPMDVVARARSRIGDPWTLFGWNCEHFAHWAHGLKPKSPQVFGALASATAIGALIFLSKRAA